MAGTGRTLFLVQPANTATGQVADVPFVGVGQWPINSGAQFTVNPIDGNALLISSPGNEARDATGKGGRLFRSLDAGQTWTMIAGTDFIDSRQLDTRYAPALAFGSPDPASPNLLNNFFYAGTGGGKLFVTFNGGGAFTDISAGLDGAIVTSIAADPLRGSRAVYVTTDSGVFYLADSKNPGTGFKPISGNLVTLTKAIFNDPNPGPRTGLPAALRTTGGQGNAVYGGLSGINTIAADWRYAIPVDPADPSKGSFPVLYVGGVGGVFRSLDQGATWVVYPAGTTVTETRVTDATDPANPVTTTTSEVIPAGGYLPSVEVTQLTLSLGNIDPNTGQPLQVTGGLNLLTAATYGRGNWAIRVEDFAKSSDPKVAAIANSRVVVQFGPRVTGVTVTQQPTAGSPTTTLRVQFDAPVLASTFDAADIVAKDAAGNPLRVLSVTPVVDAVGPANKPTVPGTPKDYHDLFAVVLAPAAGTGTATGFADLVIGPAVFDYAGFGMNQNGNATNGEAVPDPNNGGAAADAFHGLVTLDPAATGGTLFIDVPTAVVAGEPVKVVVSALDKVTGQPVTTFTGTVHFVTTDPVGIPDYTFTAADKGTRTFTVRFQKATTAAAPTTIDVTDATPGAAAPFGPARVALTVIAGPAAQFVVTGLPDPTTAGVGGSVRVQATDFFNNPAAGYTGTVTLTATDPQAALPGPYTFTTADNGVHVFPGVVLRTAGGRTVTATDATTPSRVVTGGQTVTVSPAAATSFRVSGVPTPVAAGTSVPVSVVALDPFGNTATGYRGTVKLAADDNQATFAPATYTFTAANAGTVTLPGAVTLRTAGRRIIGVSDAATPAIGGIQSGILVTPGPTRQLTVAGLTGNVVAGVPGDLTVAAADQFGNPTPGYTGTVAFTSSDPQATFAPAAGYTFTAADNGLKTLPGAVTLRTAGTQSVTATDALNGLAGSRSPVTVVPSAAVAVQFTAPSQVASAGTPVAVTLTVRDSFGNVAAGFTGAVDLTTTDRQAAFATPVTFTAADGGVKTVPVTFKTAGSRTVAASAAGLSGTSPAFSVQAGPAARLIVRNLPPTTTAGAAATFSVTAADAFGNPATGFAGTVTFASTDPRAGLPPAYTFGPADAGTRTFTVVERAAGVQTLTVTNADGQTGSADTLVIPAAGAVLTVAGFPPNVAAGTAADFTVAVRDAFGNPATGYAGTVRFTSTDPQAALPAAYTFTTADAGVRTFRAALATAGAQTLTAADATGTPAGGQSGIQVAAGPAARVVVTAPTTPGAGGAVTVTVTAVDAFGNVVTTYNGTVVPVSSDPAAGLPGNVRLTNGVGTFTVTLPTPGVQTVRVTDAGNPGLTGALAGGVTVPVPPVTTPPVVVPPGEFAAGSGANGPAQVNTYTRTGAFRNAYTPFGAAFTGGVRVATADFNGDGVADTVAGTGPGATTAVVILDGVSGRELFRLQPFEDAFTGGVYVAAGDLTGDGVPDLVVTPDQGGGPRVRIFSGAGFGQVADFFGIDDPAFRGGARAAVGDINRDGVGDLVVSAGFGGGPRVAVYDGRTVRGDSGVKLVDDFFAFEPALRDGAYVAAGDINGDGYADLITGGGPGGGPRVYGLDGQALLKGTQTPVANFFAGDATTRGGIRVAVKDLNADGVADILVGAGTGAGSRVTAYSGKATTPDGTPPELLGFDAFAGTVGGVFVG